MVADQRKTVGGKVRALARHIQSPAECKRRFGSNWDTRFLNGRVIEAVVPRPRVTEVTAWYTLENGNLKTVTLNLRSVKEGWIDTGSTNKDTIENSTDSSMESTIENMGDNNANVNNVNDNANVNDNTNEHANEDATTTAPVTTNDTPVATVHNTDWYKTDGTAHLNGVIFLGSGPSRHPPAWSSVLPTKKQRPIFPALKYFC